MHFPLALNLAFFTHVGFAAAGAAAISIPIIIHLLTRIKRKPVQWGAMKFLLEAYRKHRKRLQVEQWLLLLVRCLVLFILGFALAGPLLGGCAQKLGVDTTGRVVCLIIDDGLTQQTFADASTQRQRFDRQKQMALRLIDGLGSADQVALFRTARPASALVTPATIDRQSVRRIIETLKPRAARSDMISALKEARASLTEKSVPADRAFIVVLSDFSQGSLQADQPLPLEGGKLDELARILVAPQTASTANVQITRLTPRRHLILTGGYASEGPARIPVEIELQRFADDAPSRITNIQLALITDDASKPLAIFPKEEVRWPTDGVAGANGDANKITIQRDLIIAPETLEALNLGASASLAGRSSAATVVIRATIEPDALLEDNERFAAVELRQKLRVVVAGDAGLASSTSEKQITPAKWMTIALAPALDVGALEVTEQPAIDLDERKLTTADAVIVLRPDQLSDAGWKSLHDLALRGGMVWVFTPPTDAPATWGDALRTRMGVNWTLAIDPQSTLKPDPTGTTPAAGSEGMPLSLDHPMPQLMQRLAADWKELLRLVRVRKRLPVSVTASAGNDAVWLTTEDGQPLLVSATVGNGALFLLTTAIDLNWTNLPARPLFPALLHETLETVQARSAETARLANIISGDQPAMMRSWEDVTQLDRLASENDGEPRSKMMLLRRTEEGFTPVEPLDQPGIYRAAPQAQGRMFVVNVDGRAGNTTANDAAALDAWLSSLGTTVVLDETNPAAALSSFESRANLGQLFLWGVLLLLVAELFLARQFSHAHTGQPHTVVGVGAALYNRFVGKQKP